MGRHVKKEKINHGPKKDNLYEVKDVQRVEAARFKVGLEKEQQASRTKPENRKNVRKVSYQLGGPYPRHVGIRNCGETKKRKGKRCDAPKIAGKVGRPARSLNDKIQTEKIKEQIRQTNEYGTRLPYAPSENDGQLSEDQNSSDRNPEMLLEDPKGLGLLTLQSYRFRRHFCREQNLNIWWGNQRVLVPDSPYSCEYIGRN